MASVVTNTGYDRVMGQRISSLTEARPRPIAPEFKDHEHWLRGLGLTRMMGTIPDATAPLAFAFVRRARDSVRAFDQGCDHLRAFVKKRGTDRYFDTLERFEAALLAVCFATVMASNALERKLFKKGDGSADSRIHWLHNLIKHIDPKKLPPGHLHPLWLENDGIYGAQVLPAGVDEHHVTFDELRTEVRGLALLADQLAAGRMPIEES